MIFDQFTPQMLDFLAENHIRNSKPWYEEHKELCRTLAIEPFYQLTELMAPTMLDYPRLLHGRQHAKSMSIASTLMCRQADSQ